MATKLGSTTISKLYLGSTEITKAYLGSTEVYSSGPVVNDAFELTVETTTANESFLLPMQSVTSIDVDWGDGTVDTGITSNNPTHEYATAGTHSISVTGSATSVQFDGSGSEGKLRTVTNFGALGWTNLQNAFRDCSNMTSFECGDTDTSTVTNMQSMFYNCSSATTIDVSGFDTSSVTNMGRFGNGMFRNCSSVTTLDVSGFNTSNVTGMDGIFQGCSSLTTLDVSGFNTSNVTDMQNMFNGCSSVTTLDVSGFNTSSATRIESIFQGCSSVTTLDVSGFNTSTVTNMQSMFYNCSSVTTLDVSGFNTSSVTNMQAMFRNCSSVTTIDVSGFNTSSVTNMQAMFYDCSLVTTLNVSGFDTSSVTNMGRFGQGMFRNCSSLENLDIDGWDVISVIYAQDFLSGSNLALTTAQYDAVLIAWAAQNLQQGVTIHFGDAVPSNTGRLARNAIIRDYGWSITDGDGAHTTNDMFELTVETTAAAESLLLPLTGVTEIAVDWGDGTIETGVTADNPTHTYATAGTHSISVTGSATSVEFDGSGSEGKLRTVTNLGSLGWTSLFSSFRDCSSMTSFLCGDTDTSSVTDMAGMFRDCGSSLTTIDVSGFDTSSCTATNAMFRNCSSVTTIDVSGFDMSSVTIFSGMFQDSSSLENVDIDGWNVTSITIANNFLLNANNALTTAQYDAVLIAWAAQAVQSNVTIHFGDAQYTAGGAAETARNTLVSTYGWTITDGGAA